jgi:hypothetical protein
LVTIKGVGVKHGSSNATGKTDYEETFNGTPAAEDGEKLQNYRSAALTDCFKEGNVT